MSDKDGGSILIFCKNCQKIVAHLSAGQPLPYYYTCPLCGTRRKLVWLKHWKIELRRLPRMVATNKRTMLGKKLLENFQEVKWK